MWGPLSQDADAHKQLKQDSAAAPSSAEANNTALNVRSLASAFS